MKTTIKKLGLLIALTFSLNCFADVEAAREKVSSELNNSVKDLKELYNETSELLDDSKTESETLRKKAEILSERSQESELNPKLLKHGRAEMVTQACDSKTQVLSWDGDKWTCLDVKYVKECQDSAPDEYRYKDKDGNHICSKSDEGKALQYYWKFRGYSSSCPNNKYTKLYDCVYKNKRGNEVQVSDSYCKTAKPYVADKSCVCDKVVTASALSNSLSCPKFKNLKTAKEASCGKPTYPSCSGIIVNGMVCVKITYGGQTNAHPMHGHEKPIFRCPPGYSMSGTICTKTIKTSC